MTRSQPAPSGPAPRQDPRLYQIGVLSVLLLYGVGQLDFDVSPARIGLTMCACLAAQYLYTRVWALPRSASAGGAHSRASGSGTRKKRARLLKTADGRFPGEASRPACAG